MKIMVNSLPKSGTHLLTKLLELSEFGFSGINFSSTNVHGKRKFTKQIVRGCNPFSMAIDVGLDIPSVVRRQWVINGIHKTKSMQFMGGHFPYSDQMRVLLDENNIKTIYMIRDPRDVILSWAHYVPNVDWHYGQKGLVGKTLEERILLLLHGYQSGKYEIEGFRNILRKSEGWVETDNICLVRFEDIVGARGGGSDDKQEKSIGRILSFCGVNNLRFSLLKENLFGGTKTFRKGVIGSWREEMSQDLSAEIENHLGGTLSRMGYAARAT